MFRKLVIRGARKLLWELELREDEGAARNAWLREGLGAVGRPVRISPPLTIYPLDRVRIGDNVVIHGPSYIWAEGGVEIGSNVAIAPGVTILTSSHVIDGDALPWSDENVHSPVVLEDNVWIGMNVIVLPGVTIHEGAVVGAGSVVTKDVERCTIVGGNPAKVIRSRDVELYDRLKAEGRVRVIPTHIGLDTLVTQ